MNPLKYENEEDKSYGLAGMLLSVIAHDREEHLCRITLDPADAESPGIEFSESFHYAGNPAVSAKLAWVQMLEEVKVITGMTVSNVLCRNYVAKRRRLDETIFNALRKSVYDEADSLCQLEQDEAEMMLQESLSYFGRLYSSAAVHDSVKRFVTSLLLRRTFSPMEAMEFFREI